MGVLTRKVTAKSLGIRGKILTLFATIVLLLAAAVAFGFWQFQVTLSAFTQDVRASQDAAVGIAVVESSFKKQVQEWKDTLLRGKQPEALNKHWSGFQAQERNVHAAAERLLPMIADPESAKLVKQFIDAHVTMGEAYRRAFEKFKEHNFDSSVGDAAVAGMDRPPTELLTQAKDRLLAHASALATEAAGSGHRAMLLSGTLFVVVTIASVALFLLALQKGVSGPLARLTAGMLQLADGKFDVVLPGL